MWLSQGPSIALSQGCPLSATLFGIFIDGLQQHLQTTRLLECKSGISGSDDICLMASSPEHLQVLIDALAVYRATLAIKINMAQTKVMVVSKPSVRSPPPAPIVFIYNGLAAEHVDSFRYLGLHFHTSGSISHLIAPLTTKATWSWGVVQERHFQLQCGDTVNLTLSLLQSILVPAAVITTVSCGECTIPLVQQRQPGLICSPSMTDS